MTGFGLLRLYEEPWNPELNLAVDEALAMYAGCTGQPILRVWRNRRALVVGYTWSLREGVNLALARALGVKVYRRVTGGGPVYHDMGNLNYTIAFPWKGPPFDGVRYAYEHLLRVLLNALKLLGAHPRVANESDVVVKGFKVSGNAAAVRWGAILLHGTLLVRSDIEILRKLTPPPPRPPPSVDPVKYRVANLSELLGYEPSLHDIVSALREAAEDLLGVGFRPALPPAGVLEAARLLAARHSDPDWVAGRKLLSAYRDAIGRAVAAACSS